MTGSETASRPWRMATVINFQKGGTLPFLLALMIIYDNFSASAWVYTALHGGYGLCWLIKDRAFPDPSWERPVSVTGGLVMFAAVLGWYWVFGWLLISGRGGEYPLPDGAWIAMCIIACLVGTAIMMAADAHKFFVLRERPGLITDGLYARIRHPNYLGEMLIYGSLALLVWHWLPFVVLAWVWIGLFAVNMTNKEARMARHPEWSAYRQRSGWLTPWT